jgi:AcrR family transcriptional regulator
MANKQIRNPEQTKTRILKAATVEFALKGLGGARVDVISSRAHVQKRMMYHYFGNKEELFRIVIEKAYADFRLAEAGLEIDKIDPITGMEKLVAFSWHYFVAHPEFITLVNSENLHKARHLKASRRLRAINKSFVERMAHLLKRGERAGVFRIGLDPVQVLITLASVSYYYLNNRFTGEIVYGRKLMTAAAQKKRLAFNTDTILRLVCIEGGG